MTMAGGTARGLAKLMLAGVVAVGLGQAPALAQADFLVGQVVEVVSGGTTAAIPAGECRVVELTAWITAMADIPLNTTVNLGQDKESLACEFGWERIQSAGEERCRTSYSDAALYRNGRLLSVSQSSSDCRCTDSVAGTSCSLSTTGQCGYEALQTQQIRVCN
jgi:hypothetical protein